eukprot:GHVU01218407.1.p1 GENE.GHVU01218407.1~~GHVU01218407.1.p1  ORF type:complete len:121 (+),score=4.00 GHVU01218407.1:555-917(+)
MFIYSRSLRFSSISSGYKSQYQSTQSLPHSLTHSLICCWLLSSKTRSLTHSVSGYDDNDNGNATEDGYTEVATAGITTSIAGAIVLTHSLTHPTGYVPPPTTTTTTTTTSNATSRCAPSG